MSLNDSPQGCGDHPKDPDDVLERINEKLAYIALWITLYSMCKIVFWLIG